MVDNPYPQSLDQLARGITDMSNMLQAQGLPTWITDENMPPQQGSYNIAFYGDAVWHAFHDDAHTGPEEG